MAKFNWVIWDNSLLIEWVQYISNFPMFIVRLTDNSENHIKVAIEVF